jgi:hypothetical protein
MTLGSYTLGTFRNDNRTRLARAHTECQNPAHTRARQEFSKHERLSLAVAERSGFLQNTSVTSVALIPLSFLNHDPPKGSSLFHVPFCVISCSLRQRLAQPFYLSGPPRSLPLFLCVHDDTLSLSPIGLRLRMGRDQLVTQRTASIAGVHTEASSTTWIISKTWVSTPSGSLRSFRPSKAQARTEKDTTGLFAHLRCYGIP